MQRILPSICMALAFTTPAWSQQNDGTDVSARVSIVKPAKVPATPERIRALKLPQGFSINVFADQLQNIRVIAVDEAGNVYATRRDQGDVILLKDTDRDGRADGAFETVLHRPGAHGLAIRGKKLYVATVREIFVADIQADGRLGPATMLLGHLPDGGQHPNRTLAFGPDGMLYASIGSSCNACNEPIPSTPPCCACHRTAKAASSSPAACATPSVTTGIRPPANCGGWTTASISSATTNRPKS